jgi:hypothetical protein
LVEKNEWIVEIDSQKDGKGKGMVKRGFSGIKTNDRHE